MYWCLLALKPAAMLQNDHAANLWSVVVVFILLWGAQFNSQSIHARNLKVNHMQLSFILRLYNVFISFSKIHIILLMHHCLTCYVNLYS